MTNNTKQDAETVLRKLGINEAYQLAMYLINQYRGTILSCRYAIPPSLVKAESQSQLEQAFRLAVADIVIAHPMLQVAVKDATHKSPSWIRLQSLDLTQHIKWVYISENEDFERTIQETFVTQLDKFFPDFDLKLPGWKFTIIRWGYAPVMEVLLTWNHPHFDAMGAKVLQEDLLKALNKVKDKDAMQYGLEGNVIRLPQTLPILPPPIESLKSLPLDFTFFLKTLWEELGPRFLTRDISHANWCPIPPSPYKTQYRAFFIDETSLANTLSLCRQNKTTITGLLNGLALIAFSIHLDSKTGPAFQSSTIVDHRRNLPPAPPNAPWKSSDRAVGNFVTQLIHKYDTNLVSNIRSILPADAHEGQDLSPDLQRELWTAAARSRQEILGKLETGLRNDLVGIFKWVTDWQKTMSDIVKKPRQFTWLITNIGVLDSGEEVGEIESWSIERAQFGLSAETHAAVIEIAAVSAGKKGMCVSANWHDAAVDVRFNERIMANLERWLIQLGKAS